MLFFSILIILLVSFVKLFCYLLLLHHSTIPWWENFTFSVNLSITRSWKCVTVTTKFAFWLDLLVGQFMNSIVLNVPKKLVTNQTFFVMFHYSNFCFAVERLFDDGLRSQGVNYHLKSRRKCPLIKNVKKLFLNKIVMFPPTNRYYMCLKALIIRQIGSKNGNRYLLTLSFRNLIIMLAY